MLNKAIEHGKEHRKPYRGGKAISKRCRNHGGCDWCRENRQFKFRDKKPAEPGFFNEGKTMTIKELKEQINYFPDDAIILHKNSPVDAVYYTRDYLPDDPKERKNIVVFL